MLREVMGFGLRLASAGIRAVADRLDPVAPPDDDDDPVPVQAPITDETRVFLAEHSPPPPKRAEAPVAPPLTGSIQERVRAARGGP